MEETKEETKKEGTCIPKICPGGTCDKEGHCCKNDGTCDKDKNCCKGCNCEEKKA